MYMGNIILCSDIGVVDYVVYMGLSAIAAWHVVICVECVTVNKLEVVF